MSVYSYTDSLRLSEQYLYGSSRIGSMNPGVNLDRSAPTGTNMPLLSSTGNLNTFTRGNKFFELSNHLGNVLVTLSDKKRGVQNGTTGSVRYYLPIVKGAQDYFPGGMQMPGRKFNAAGSSYRYSINGQEKEKELNENITSAEFWMYDSRIGRRWNVDPIETVGESPYACFHNNPVFITDPFGNVGDTTLNTPGGNSITLPSGATFTTFEKGKKYVHSSNGKEVSVQPGQLKSVTINNRTFTARFNSKDLSFSGYETDDGDYFAGYDPYTNETFGTQYHSLKDVISVLNPFKETEAYTSVQFKTTLQKKGDMLKSVIPVGLQATYNTSTGVNSGWIAPDATYFNLGLKNYWTDIRVMPGQGNYNSGEISGGRALFTVPYLSRGIFKTQLDIATSDITSPNFDNTMIGSRGVIESPVNLKLPFTNTSYSAEWNFGIRYKIDPYFLVRRALGLKERKQ